MTAPLNDERLTAWIDGTLAPDAQRALDAELVRDPELAQALRILQATRSTVRDLGPQRAPPGFADRVLDRLDDAEPTHRAPHWARSWQAVAVAAAAIFAIAWLVPQAPDPAPTRAAAVPEDAPPVTIGQTPRRVSVPGALTVRGASVAALESAVRDAGGALVADDDATVVIIDAAQVPALLSAIGDVGKATPRGPNRSASGRVRIPVTLVGD